jgi:hemerythrin
MSGQRLYADTGFAPIDRDHRELSDALGNFVHEVNAGNAAQVGSSLEAIIAGVISHFGYEERLMKEYAYPLQPRHEEAHALFVGDMRRFQKLLQKSGVDANFRRWGVRRPLEWFRFHILTHDMGLGQFLLRAGALDAPLSRTARV